MTPKQMRKELDSLQEGMYDQKKKSRPAALPANPATNDVFIDRSMEHPDKIAITLKGRTALVDADKITKIIEKLENLLKEIDDGADQ